MLGGNGEAGGGLLSFAEAQQGKDDCNTAIKQTNFNLFPNFFIHFSQAEEAKWSQKEEIGETSCLGSITWTKFDEFSEHFRMGGGSFPIRKIMLRFFGKGKALRAPISRTKAQHFFPKIGWGVRGRLEVFRKFIKFGPGSLPLFVNCLSENSSDPS